MGFKDLNLSEEIQKAIDMLNYKVPSQVQQEVIPLALVDNDIIVKSQTGSGKTAAFAIPLCEKVVWEENKPQVLVLTPTRELALQVKEDFFNIGRFKRIKVAAIFGKYPFIRQEKMLKQKTHVVVGTPGRVLDHLDQGTLDTSEIKYLVLDEADEMLNMGFLEQVGDIIDCLPGKRVSMIFSATMPPDIEALCRNYMAPEPVMIEIESKVKTTDQIKQEVIAMDREDKMGVLLDVTKIQNPDSCMIFCNTIQKVEQVTGELKAMDYTCDCIHGDMLQKDRQAVMKNFKKGLFRYLIATDVAARGIDVQDISLVLNYDIPLTPEPYVHRIGRTGRKGKEGHAITFLAPREDRYLASIERYMDKELESISAPETEVVIQAEKAFYAKMDEKPEIKEDKGANLNKEIMKLHINAGKKTKMRPTDIVGTLCNIPGITKDDIGIIDILDISTFVEILNNKGEMVYEALQNKPIKGRMRKVSKKIED